LVPAPWAEHPLDSVYPYSLLLGEMAHICIHCRTIVDDGASACDGGAGHRVIDLNDREGRELLLGEVWGPPSLRRRVRQLTKAGGAGAGVGAGLETCKLGFNGCDCLAVAAEGELAAILGGILVVGVAFVGVYYLGVKIVELVRRRRQAPKPKGALLPVRRSRGERVQGEVLDGVTTESTGASACVAHELNLSAKRFVGSALMLRDGISAGFRVSLPSGQIATVPAGRVRLKASNARVVSDYQRVRQRLVEIDPLRSQVDDLDPFPFDHAAEVCIAPGDWVELVGEFERQALGEHRAEGYRDAAAATLVASGVPLVRLLPR
jgi:hypothetical protein